MPASRRHGPTAWLAAVLVSWAAGCGASGEAGVDERTALLGDHRLAVLLQPCQQSGFYSRDVSDMVAVLIEKLEHGKTDALKRAKEELGALGAEAAVALDRVVDENASNAMRAPLVENAIDAAGFNLSDEGHQVVLKGLAFPQESIRRQALIALAARHARPTDFEVLLERVEGFETPENKRIGVRALFLADRPRAEARVLSWLEQGLHRELWINALPFFSESRTPEVQTRCAELYGEYDPLLGMHLAAAAAAGGDEGALAFLRGKLAHEVPMNLRTLAVTALANAGLFDELGPASHEDPADSVRVIALDEIASAEGVEDVRARIAIGLDDPSPQVRGHVLKLLVAMGDPDARARALSMLGEEAGLLQTAIHALTEPLKEDPTLARQAWERLLERHALEEHRPLQKRAATYKAMGIVPLPEAALFLHELGMEHRGERMEGLDIHDWLMIQASNTGRPGRSALIPLLETETDPNVRIGLIHAISSNRDAFAREALLALLEGGDCQPLEILFIADRLIRVGPSWEVAPALKRASYAMEGDLEARRALQCLLWHWY